MISSKRITAVSALLTALALFFTVYMMIKGGTLCNGGGTVRYSDAHIASFSPEDYHTDYSSSAFETITLTGGTAVSDSKSVSVNGGEITVMGGGVYVLSGELTDGIIIVDSDDGAEVRLVLNGVSVTSADFSALYIKQCAKTVISLADGTENSFSDGESYSEEKLEDGKPSAAVYSKDDLTVNGSGSLTVTGNYEDGIKVNDIFRITGGTLRVTAADDGVNVNDYIAASGAVLEVTSGGDAVKCENESEEKGFIAFEDISVNISSGGDGIYASSAVYANETAAVITSGGAAAAPVKSSGMRSFMSESVTNENEQSTKALKAGTDIIINGGSYTLDSADDSIHSDGDVSISGGSFTIASGDDAVHAEGNAEAAPESMDITLCNEGIEGAYVTINGGDISIVSNDDAINAVGMNASDAPGRTAPGGMTGNEAKTEDDDIYLTINGGSIYIETSGDGIDSNGSAVINGGSVEIYGPDNSGNGSIDVGDGGYVLMMNGGSLTAAGSSGMAEYPYSGSVQSSLVFYLDETYAAGSEISVCGSSGNEIISGVPAKNFDFVCVSVPDIEQGETYTLYINGTEIASLDASGTVSVSGSAGGTGRGGLGGTAGGMGRRQQQW